MDREKVIKGLELCTNISQDSCLMLCPYKDEKDETYSGFCEQVLKQDALALLKEQEPRVMTLDEITEIYVEFKGNAYPGRLINFDLLKIIMYMDDGRCRLWTGKPTDEQRQAVKWE